MTASADGVYLTSAGSSIVYAARLGGSGYEIHERTPTLDTKLAELPLTSPGLLITTNDTDVFVAGHDAANEVTLWRVSRAGGAVTTLTKRTTSYSLVGQTLAANDGQLLWNVLGLLDLADVSRPMELEPGSVQAVALAHENVYAYEVTEHSLALEQLTPVPTIINRVPYDGTPLPMAGDFGHLAFGYRTTLSLFDFATNNQRVCPFNPPVVRAGDSTRWLALDGTTVYTIEK